MTAPKAVYEPAPITIQLAGPITSASDRARILAILKKELLPVTVTPVKASPAKAGYLTTEFWVTVLTAVGATAAAATNNLPPRYATLASTIAVVSYAISRGLAKR
jgi:hypothetical protein